MAVGCGQAGRHHHHHQPHCPCLLPAALVPRRWHPGMRPRFPRAAVAKPRGSPLCHPCATQGSCSWGAAQKQPPPSLGYFRDTSMSAVAELTVSSFLFGNHPSTGGNVPLGVQPSSSASRSCCNTSNGASAALLGPLAWCTHPCPAWGAGAHGTHLRAGGAVLMVSFHDKQEGWRWTCIPWEASQTEPRES